MLTLRQVGSPGNPYCGFNTGPGRAQAPHRVSALRMAGIASAMSLPILAAVKARAWLGQ
jgi:hypothetical protein